MNEHFFIGSQAFYKHLLCDVNPFKGIAPECARQWNNGWWHAWETANGKH